MKVETLKCDVCGELGATHYRTLAYIKNTCVKDFVGMTDIDLCDECAKKATNLIDTSVMSKSAEIKEPKDNDELKKNIVQWFCDNHHKYIHLQHLEMPKDKDEDFFLYDDTKGLLDTMFNDLKI